jgi:amino acid adenylation domain-containing protein
MSMAAQGRLPLSHGQQALWFLHQLASDSGAYHVIGLVRLQTRLSPAVVERAFITLARRHAALRATFCATDGQPQCITTEAPGLDFAAVDALGWDQRRLQDHLGQSAYHPFDLERGPLLRVRLVLEAAGSSVLLVVVHHIVADFWSLAVLMSELGAAYRAEAAGAPVELPPLPLSYADWIDHQESLLAGADGERLWTYWRRQLSGSLPVAELPTDRPRPPVQTYRGAARSLRLPAALVAALRGLGRAHQTTLFATLLAAFQVLLYRVTGQRELLIGSPVAGRSARGWGGVVGYFVNPLVLRVGLDGAGAFAGHLARVRAVTLEALAHQHLPFPLLAELLQPRRDPSRSPLFQVMFTLQKVPVLAGGDASGFALGEEGSRLRLGGMEFESVRLTEQTCQFDLALLAAEGAAGELRMAARYSTDLFDASTIERLLQRLLVVLHGAAAEPGSPLAMLPLLLEGERHQLLFGWNDTGGNGAPECLHGLFARQAARSPHAVAAIRGDRHLSYGELARSSRRLAGRLRGWGVGAEVAIGIHCERSLAMLTAILAVLEAGGAYVPLDPQYPAERLALIAADAGIALILTQELLAPKLPAGGPPAVCLDSAAPAAPLPAAGAAARLTPAAAGPDNLAYVIYTSGSTGRPKGVAVEHRSACCLLRWAGELFAPPDLARVLAATSINFDLSIFELFAPLAAGGTVVLVDDPLALPRAADVTLINTVPSALRELLRDGPLPPSVATVNAAGETLHRGLVERIHAAGRVRRVFNLYGPSEDTTYSTWERVERGASGSPPIGRPIRGTRAYLLDRDLQLVPVGSVGEIYLGGEGLARGYLARPVLTAGSFVPDPFSGAPGSRLYRTGDLARHLSDGRLEHLGRIDHQVKLRGFRVELGEIEQTLAGHPAVQEAAVLLGRDRAGEAALIAYVAGSPVAASELRHFVRQSLPAHLVPAAVVFVPALPRTPSGKIDRGALPGLEGAGAETAAAFVVPRTPLEEMVAGIFAAVLGRDRVSVAENFFDLGGHSLKAVQVASRVRDACGVDLPLRRLFELPAAAALAACLEAALRMPRVRAAPPLRRVERQGPLPLSFGQQRLWFLDRLQPGSPAYLVPAGLRLCGRLDVAALAGALCAIVERHEALRTTFADVDGEPCQRISPAVPVAMPVLDLAALPDAAGEARRRQLAAARRPCDLAQGPLVRFELLRLGEAEHLLMATLHHIACDGWSLGILLSELAAAYRALAAREPPRLPELPVQYADYAAWQRAWLDDAELALQLAYWRRQLEGVTPLELPLDRPRPPVESWRGATETFTLPADLAGALRRLARQEAATPFLVLLAGFQALLWRYSGQPDFAVGTPLAGRERSEVEGLIGFFANTLVLRCRLAPERPWRQAIARARETLLAAHAHQGMPFERLVAELAPTRDLGRSPLFQVMLAFQEVTVTAYDLGELSLIPLRVDRGAAHHDLGLEVMDGPDGLAAVLEYRTDLFDRTSMLRLAGHLESLLVGADPGSRLCDLPLLRASERQLLLREWSGAGQPPDAEPAHRPVADAAARAPLSSAVEDATGREVSYGELMAWSRWLARRLVAAGVAAETVVGLAASPSPAMVAGLLAILETGGAYMPIDVEAPRQRLAAMLAEAGVAVILAEPDPAARLPPYPARVLLLDAEPDLEPELEPRSIAVPAAGASAAHRPNPDSPAYVLYTSGSTGRPKGVVVPHRALAVYSREAARRYALGSGDRLLQFASLSFDISVEEIFACLAGGATLVLRGGRGPVSPAELLAETERRAITALDLPTAYWHEMVAEVRGGAAVPPRLRTMIIGGEAALPAAWAEWRRRAPWVRLFNTYGPTETTVVATVHEATPGEEPLPATAAVSIGRSIPGTRTYLLAPDAATALPAGVPGELFIGGPGLARGYLAQPDRTAERFVPDAFGEAPGARLFRTGDLARFLPDGRLEFRGRADRQAKIRGYRVEPGEVEAALADHPAVREAAVVVRADPAGAPSLALYVGPVAGTAPTAGELRAFLAQRLPAYMMPAAVTLLDRLPRTPSGKLDRRALPAPAPQGGGGAPPAAGGPASPPASPLQELVAGIVCEVLGRESVGFHESFFELGGHSLAAIRVVSRLDRVLNREVPLRELFVHPTVAGLAHRLEQLLRDQAAPAAPAPPLVRVARDGDLPLSFGQQRLWFLDRLDPGSAAFHLPAALRCRGPLRAAAVEAALAGIVNRHEALRTRIGFAGGEPVQSMAPPSRYRLGCLDLRRLPPPRREAEAWRLAAGLATRPFDLTRDLPWRAALAALDEQQHLLLLNFHHIAADGWSLDILAAELAALYNAAATGAPAALPDLPVQYADFAVWQRRRLQGETLARHHAYWRQQLAGAPALELPTDRPRSAVRGGRGARRPFHIGAVAAADLERVGRGAGATLFMTLLAAFEILLCRTSGQQRVVVGTPVAGRGRPELEGLVGCFINTLALAGDLGGEPDCLTFLARTREVALGAYLHQEVPFEQLIDMLQPERDLSRSPLFQVMLALRQAARGPAAFAGIAVELAELDSGAAKYDLTLALERLPAAAGGELRGWLEYSADLFDAATIELLALRLATLLGEIIRDSRRRLDDLPLLSAAERHQLQWEWNDTAVTPAQPADCIHQLFERQAACRPAAIAVVCGQLHLSYLEVERRANRLAHHLCRRGAGAETLVGICLERGSEQVVALLAVLKAGAAYVPLDPGYPAERLAFMARDARLALLVTEERLLDRLMPAAAAGAPSAPETPDATDTPAIPSIPEARQIIALDRDAALIAAGDPGRPAAAAAVAPDRLAYVIYTSGSTGRPKGVQIAHRAVVSFLAAMAERPGLAAGDALLALTSLSFDIAGLEILLPLAVGGRTVVSQSGGAAPEELLALLADRGIDAMQATPATWQLLLAAGWRGSPGLTALCGGEAMPPALAARLLPAAAAVWNVYGPTETTIWSTREHLRQGETVAIGRPIDGTEVYLLSPHLQLVPRGARGQLAIGGAGLARGYRGQPALTAERFVPDAFGGAAGARLYLTGDLARQRSDGRLDCLGRIDHQVKLRGHRIEPGEIESRLAAHPSVREAAVLVRPDATGEPALVAYVAPADPNTPPADLAGYLRRSLPPAMVPALFVTLPALPRTPNGKLDRRALPPPGTPGTAGTGPRQAFIAPRTATEARLAAIWGELLGVERVGAEDHFFHLGGHSLKAIQLASRLRDELGVEVPLRMLFAEPRLGDLARAIESQSPRAAEPAGIVAQARGRHRLDQLLVEMEKLSRPGRRPVQSRVRKSARSHE